MGPVGDRQQSDAHNDEKHRCHTLPFLVAKVLASGPATHCGREKTAKAFI
jgi:hypothetical protein